MYQRSPILGFILIIIGLAIILIALGDLLLKLAIGAAGLYLISYGLRLRGMPSMGTYTRMYFFNSWFR